MHEQNPHSSTLWQRLQAKITRWQTWASPQTDTSRILTFPERENLRRARLLAAVLIASQPLDYVLILTSLYPLFDLGALAILIFTAIWQFACIFINRRGKVAWATNLYLLEITCGIGVGLFTPHFNAPIFGIFIYPFFCIPIVASAYIRHHRAPVIYCVLACLIVGVHIALDKISLQQSDQTHNLSILLIWSVTVSAFTVLALISCIGAKSMEDALLNADRAEELEAMNEELTAIQMELEAQYHQLEEANTQLEHLAATDGLTGLANHRAFQEELTHLIARTERDDKSLALILLDVDYFKKYNDSFGHPAGDEVLRTFAALLRETLRKADFPARYGGEEFAALLYDANTEVAAQIAERFRIAVASHPFPHREVTVSIGVSIYRPNEEGAALIQRADSALYHAKHNGRNCVTLFEQIELHVAA